MTTDITNVQNAFMMVIRIALAFLALVIGSIMVVTLRIFNKVFQKYDDLNASVQENISAIRVVKAEGLLAFNNPAMMVAVYFCIIMVSWMGAHFIVVDKTLTTGDLTSLFSYIMSLLMSLMMLSMVVVMISMSLASI